MEDETRYLARSTPGGVGRFLLFFLFAAALRPVSRAKTKTRVGVLEISSFFVHTLLLQSAPLAQEFCLPKMRPWRPRRCLRMNLEAVASF